MKRIVIGLGLLVSFGFYSNLNVNAEDQFEMLSIIEKGSNITTEDDIRLKEISEEVKIKRDMDTFTNIESNGIYAEQPIAPRMVVINPLTNWIIGTKIVKDMGYPNTAMYMKHAEANQRVPGTHTSNNNSWAKDVLFNNEILGEQYNKVRTWIRSGKAGSINTSGSFAFTSGDKYYALHNVNYAYTLTRKSDGGVTTSGTVTDKYDFEWSKYDNIKAGFANNYAKHAQNMGYIKPYNIIIKGKSN